MAYDRPKNTGFLFPQKGQKSRNAPNMTGKISVDEELLEYLQSCLDAGDEAEVSIAAWRKVSGKGTPFLSIKASIPREQKKQPPKKDFLDDMDDEIPF